MVTRTARVAGVGLGLIAFTSVASALPVTAAPAGCAGIDADAYATMSTTDALAQIPGLSTFAAALGASDVLTDVASDQEFTVFVPTDEAFAAVPDNVFDAIVADPELLDDVVGYHVVVGESFAAADLVAPGTIDTSSGPLPAVVAGGVVTLGGQATVICPDIVTADGTIHVIDTVLDPPAEQFTPGGSSLPGTSVPVSGVGQAEAPE